MANLLKYLPGDPIDSFDRASAATYETAAGGVVAVAAEIPRDDHRDATDRSIRTLLIERARTNFCTDSQDLASANWQLWDGAAKGTSGLTAPDGSATAGEINHGATGTSQVYHTVSNYTANSTYTISGWMRVASGTGTARLGAFQGTADTFSPDLALTSDWQRFSWTFTPATVDTTVPHTVAWANGSDAVARTVQAWGVQMEAGPGPSSYIPTTTATTSRAAEQASVFFPHAPQEQTVYVKWVERGLIDTKFNRLFFIGNATDGSPKLQLFVNSAATGWTLQHHSGSSSANSNSSELPAHGDVVEFRAVLYSDGSVQGFMTINGGAEASWARSGANAFAAAWSGTNFWLGSRGSTSSVGLLSIHGAAVETGVQTLDFMRATMAPATSATVVQPAFSASTAQAFAPTVVASASVVAPQFAASTAQVFAPTVAQGAAPVTVTPGFAASTAQAFAPAVLASARVVAPAFAPSTARIFAPVVEAGVPAGTIAPQVAESTAVVFAPAVVASSRAIGLTLTTSTAQSFSPAVIATSRVIAPAFTGSTSQAFSLTVLASARVVAPQFRASTAQAFTPKVLATSLVVAPVFAASTAQVFAPTMLAGLPTGHLAYTVDVRAALGATIAAGPALKSASRVRRALSSTTITKG